MFIQQVFFFKSGTLGRTWKEEGERKREREKERKKETKNPPPISILWKFFFSLIFLSPFKPAAVFLVFFVFSWFTEFPGGFHNLKFRTLEACIYILYIYPPQKKQMLCVSEVFFFLNQKCGTEDLFFFFGCKFLKNSNDVLYNTIHTQPPK